MPKNFLISATLKIDDIKIGKTNISGKQLFEKLFGKSFSKNITKGIEKGVRDFQRTDKGVRVKILPDTKKIKASNIPGLDKKSAETLGVAFATTFANALRNGFSSIPRGNVLNFDKIFDLGQINKAARGNLTSLAKKALGQINEAASKIDVGRLNEVSKLLKNLTPGAKSEAELASLRKELFQFDRALGQIESAAKSMVTGLANSLGIGKAALLEALDPVIASVREFRTEAGKGIRVSFNVASQELNLDKQSVVLEKAARKASIDAFNKLQSGGLRQDFVKASISQEKAVARASGRELGGKDRSAAALRANNALNQYIKSLRDAGLLEGDINKAVLRRVISMRTAALEQVKTTNETVVSAKATRDSSIIHTQLVDILKQEAQLLGINVTDHIKTQTGLLKDQVDEHGKIGANVKQRTELEASQLKEASVRLQILKRETAEINKQVAAQSKSVLRQSQGRSARNKFVRASVEQAELQAGISGTTFDRSKATRDSVREYQRLVAIAKARGVQEQELLSILSIQTSEIQRQVQETKRVSNETAANEVSINKILRLQQKYAELVRDQVKTGGITRAVELQRLAAITASTAALQGQVNGYSKIIALLNEAIAAQSKLTSISRGTYETEIAERKRAGQEAKKQAAIDAQNRQKAIKANKEAYEALKQANSEAARERARQQNITDPKKVIALENAVNDRIGPTTATLGDQALRKVSTDRIVADTARLAAKTKEAKEATKQLTNVTKEYEVVQNKATSAISRAGNAFEIFGHRAGLAIGRYIAYLVPTSVLFAFFGAVRKGVSDFIEFEKVVTKLEQIMNLTNTTAKALGQTIKNTAKATGLSAVEIGQGAAQLAQTGLAKNASGTSNPQQIGTTIDLISRAQLGPTFGSIEQTVNGLIAVMNQFNLELTDTGRILDITNQLSKDFAIEAGDFFTAVERGGSVFAVTGGNFEQFARQLTALRSETRESAETLGTFFKTIGARLFRGTESKVLEAFDPNILASTSTPDRIEAIAKAIEKERQAVENASAAEKALQRRREIRLATELAGTRQAGRFLAVINGLIDKSDELEKSLAASFGSINRDIAKRLDDIGISFAKLAENISQVFQSVFNGPIGGFLQGTADALNAVTSNAASSDFLSGTAIPGAATVGAVGAISIAPSIIRGFTDNFGLKTYLGEGSPFTQRIDTLVDKDNQLINTLEDLTGKIVQFNKTTLGKLQESGKTPRGLPPTVGGTTSQPNKDPAINVGPRRLHEIGFREAINNPRATLGTIGTRFGTLAKSGLGNVGRFLKSRSGLAVGGLAAGYGANALGDFLLNNNIEDLGTINNQFRITKSTSSRRKGLQTVAGGLSGAAVGASLGAVGGAPGVILGAAIGGLVGSIRGLQASYKEEIALRKELGDQLRESLLSQGSAAGGKKAIGRGINQVEFQDFFDISTIEDNLKKFDDTQRKRAERQGLTVDSISSTDLINIVLKEQRAASKGGSFDQEAFTKRIQDLSSENGLFALDLNDQEVQKLLQESLGVADFGRALLNRNRARVSTEYSGASRNTVNDIAITRTAASLDFTEEQFRALLRDTGALNAESGKLIETWDSLTEIVKSNIQIATIWSSALEDAGSSMSKSISTIKTTFEAGFLSAGDVKNLLEGSFTALINKEALTQNLQTEFDSALNNIDFNTSSLSQLESGIAAFTKTDFGKIFGTGFGPGNKSLEGQLKTFREISGFFTKNLLSKDKKSFIGAASAVATNISSEALTPSGPVGAQAANVLDARQTIKDFFKQFGGSISDSTIDSLNFEDLFKSLAEGGQKSLSNTLKEQLGLDNVEQFTKDFTERIDVLNLALQTQIDLYKTEQEVIKSGISLEQERINLLAGVATNIETIINSGGVGQDSSQASALRTLFRDISSLNFNRNSDTALLASDAKFKGSLSGAISQADLGGVNTTFSNVVSSLKDQLIPAFDDYVVASIKASQKTADIIDNFNAIASEQKFDAIKSGFDTIFDALKTRASDLGEALQRNLSKIQGYLSTISRISDVVTSNTGTDTNKNVGLVRDLSETIFNNLTGILGSQSAATSALSSDTNIGLNLDAISKAAISAAQGLNQEELTSVRGLLQSLIGADPNSKLSGQDFTLQAISKALDIGAASKARSALGIESTAQTDLKQAASETDKLISAYSDVSLQLQSYTDALRDFNDSQREATQANIELFKRAIDNLPQKIDIGGRVEIDLRFGDLSRLESLVSSELRNEVLAQALEKIIDAFESQIPGSSSTVRSAIT